MSTIPLPPIGRAPIQVQRTARAPFLRIRFSIRDKILVSFLVVVVLIGAVAHLHAHHVNTGIRPRIGRHARIGARVG